MSKKGAKRGAKPPEKKSEGFGAAPLAPKFKRRVPLISEDLPSMKRIMREIKGQNITLEQFVLLMGPHTGDKGAALTKVMNLDLSAFRRLVLEVYKTMTQDASDVMAVTQKELGQLYAEKQRELVDNMLRSLQTIKDYVPGFDFRQYFEDPEKYLNSLFKLADIPDDEEIEAARRQLAYHRLQWLQSEGERLQAENVNLQERLSELKKIQRKEIAEAVMKEQEAERQRQELEQKQEEMQNELEELCDELHETIISGEKNIMDTKKEAKMKTLAKKKKVGPDAKKGAQRKEDWNVQVATEYSKAQIQGEAILSKNEASTTLKPETTKKKLRVPLRSQRPWQQQKETSAAPTESESTIPTKAATSKTKVKRKKKSAPVKSRPVWQDVNLEEFDVGGAAIEEQVPMDIFQPSYPTPRSGCPPTCGTAPPPQSMARAPSPPRTGRRVTGPRDTWRGFQ